MNLDKRPWFWNVLLVLTILVCTCVLILHFKNWVSTNETQLKLRSGFYSVAIPYTDMDSLVFVERIPPMERLNGFSALEQEKGIFREFKDSLTDKKVRVFVDNINHQKLKVVYRDSFYIYLNLKDSVQTLALKNDIKAKMDFDKVPN